MEVVRDLAGATPDHDRYLASMFERVSARLDQAPIEQEQETSVANMRESIDIFFVKARK